MGALATTWACITALSLACLTAIHPWRTADLLHDAAWYTACITATGTLIILTRS